MPVTKSCVVKTVIKSLKAVLPVLQMQWFFLAKSCLEFGRNDNQLLIFLVNKVNERVFSRSIALCCTTLFMQHEVEHCLARELQLINV